MSMKFLELEPRTPLKAGERQGKCTGCKIRYVWQVKRMPAQLYKTKCPGCGKPLLHTIYLSRLAARYVINPEGLKVEKK